MAKKIAKPAAKPAPKPAPKPVPEPAEKNLKPRPVPFQTPQPAPLDLVRNPNFNAAMAQQNYANLMRDQQARIAAESGAPSADPGFDKSKQRGGKEIILSFAGGQYGSVNDEAADAIAKKYNLDIVNKPNPNKDEGPKIYRFSVKGDVDKGLSGIKNEPGVRYAEPNYRKSISTKTLSPFLQYEDQRMKAALNGEELPTPPVGYIERFDKNTNLTPPAEIGSDFRPSQGPQAGGSSRFDDYRGQPQPGQPRPSGQDFIDLRDPNRAYTADMVDYIDPATGERTSRTRGVVPAPGSRFVPANGNKFNPNLMRDQQARLAAQGQYTKGRLMGAPTNRPIPPEGGLGGLTADQAGIPAEQRKILDDLMAKMQLDIAARDVEQQNMKKAGAFTIGGTPDKPIYGSMAGPVYADGTFVDATNQQAQNYQNLLQQGIQRSNTMNQDAASNFANLQAGAPTMQPAIPSPQLGGVTAQPRGVPRPRQPRGFGSPIGRSAF